MCEHQWADITNFEDGGKCDRFFCVHCGKEITQVPTISKGPFEAILSAPDPMIRRHNDLCPLAGLARERIVEAVTKQAD